MHIVQFCRSGSEIYFCIIIAALQKLLHLLLGRLSRVGAGACVKDRICCDVVESLKEDILRNKALLCRIAVSAVVLDAVRDVQLIVETADICDQVGNLLVIVSAAEVHIVSNHAVTLFSFFILRIERDDLRKIHSVCCAVDDMSALVCENRAGLVCHGVNDAEQSG